MLSSVDTCRTMLSSVDSKLPYIKTCSTVVNSKCCHLIILYTVRKYHKLCNGYTLLISLCGFHMNIGQTFKMYFKWNCTWNLFANYIVTSCLLIVTIKWPSCLFTAYLFLKKHQNWPLQICLFLHNLKLESETLFCTWNLFAKYIVTSCLLIL